MAPPRCTTLAQRGGSWTRGVTQMREAENRRHQRTRGVMRPRFNAIKLEGQKQQRRNDPSSKLFLVRQLNDDESLRREFMSIYELLRIRGRKEGSNAAMTQWVLKDGARRGGFEVSCGSIHIPERTSDGRLLTDIFRDLRAKKRGAWSPIAELLFRFGNMLKVYVETVTQTKVPEDRLWGVIQVESDILGNPKYIHMCLDRRLGADYRCSFAKMWRSTLGDLLGTPVGSMLSFCWFTRTIISDTLQAGFPGYNVIFELFGGRVRNGRVDTLSGDRHAFHTWGLGDNTFNALFASSVHDPTLPSEIFSALVNDMLVPYPAWCNYGPEWTPAPNRVGWQPTQGVTTPWVYRVESRDLIKNPSKDRKQPEEKGGAPPGDLYDDLDEVSDTEDDFLMEEDAPEEAVPQAPKQVLNTPLPQLAGLYSSGESVELFAPDLPL
ncbi:ORF2 [Silurid herpesvirus 1]|nr:ORF2 [Silurid herpesvirus 1]AVP72252.1 ORF2 [Silurid herpesvirus 1]